MFGHCFLECPSPLSLLFKLTLVSIGISCVEGLDLTFYLEETDNEAGELGTEVFPGVCGTGTGDAGAGSDVLAGETGVMFDFGGSP